MYELPTGDNFNAEIFYHDPVVVVAGLNSPWVRRRKVHLADLVAERWALLPYETLAGETLKDAFRAQGLRTTTRNGICTVT